MSLNKPYKNNNQFDHVCAATPCCRQSDHSPFFPPLRVWTDLRRGEPHGRASGAHGAVLEQPGPAGEAIQGPKRGRFEVVGE